MPFNSLKYFLFLPIVYLIFYFVGERKRWMVLLAASLFFYAALNVPYLLVVLVLVAMTTYGFGIWIDDAKAEKSKRALLWGGIAANVLILVVMKYLPFLSENLRALSTLLSLNVQFQPFKAFVAIGVSYYVFQAISYLIDIYLEIDRPERHFGYFSLYLAFFPKLLQGPIERASDLLPQFKQQYNFDYDNMRSGMLLIAWGLFKKIVVADRLAQFVNPVYSDVHSYTGVTFLVIIYFYAIQIYCDFSGYTDMALGTARLFNIDLTQNFKAPYLANSIADFWRRWHISFSRWILDYIFKPLQMQWRNWKNLGTASALIITFLVSGIWHGSTWGFIIWGLLHGLYLASSVFYKPFQIKLHKMLGIEKSRILELWKIFVTFNLVCFAWIFFRSNTVADSYYIILNIVHDFRYLLDLKYVRLQFRGLGLDNTDFILSLFFIFIVVIVNVLEIKKRDLWDTILHQPAWVRWPVYYLILFFIVYFAPYNTAKNFIYLQF